MDENLVLKLDCLELDVFQDDVARGERNFLLI